MKKVYLDHSATTRMDKRVFDAMMPYFRERFGNASSVHGFGQDAAKRVERARGQVAGFLKCDPEEVVFTSGATESNNLVLRGVTAALGKNGLEDMHVITSRIEHDSMLEPASELERRGIEVTYVDVRPNGVVDPKSVKRTIRETTVLVSIMYVNNEVGSIQPIKEIGHLINEENARRAGGAGRGRIYFHTDATQAVNFLDCNVGLNRVDLLSLSGHKIYGPKGVGALYVREGTVLAAQQLGGHHEKNRRSGTLNVPGIVGLGAAIGLLDPETVEKNVIQIAAVRDLLVEGILGSIPDVTLNTDRQVSTPAHAHFSFAGVDGESILIGLDMEGIAVSTGSACASMSDEPAPALLAMGIDPALARNSIRFTLGKNNTEAEIVRVLEVLPPIVKRLREISPAYRT